MSKPLTPKQEKFCQEYIINLNGTQAAIRAGYSQKTAYSMAEKLLKKPEIKAKLAQSRQEQESRTQIDADWALQRYGEIANFKIEDIVSFNGSQVIFKPMSEWTPEAKGAVSSLKLDRNGNVVEIKTHSKLAALDSIAKHLGLFGDLNTAIATLKKYSLNLGQSPDGKWFVVDSGMTLVRSEHN
jgi:phage terminase small subunit